jgi:hypothetical protein
MALQKPHNWIDQVSEQDREGKDYDDGASDIDNGQRHCK